jgi:halocarboxylic acid dehydrogenase DehI
MSQVRTGTLPRLQLVPEDTAPPDVAAIYEETRNLLGIPWTAAIFQGYAMYPPLLRLAWAELRPNVVTLEFHADARQLREQAAAGMQALYRPGYDRSQVERWGGDPHRIRAVGETFNYGNPKLLICARAVSRSLEGRRNDALREETDLRPAEPPPGEERIRHRRIDMVDPVNPPAVVAPTFLDIKQTLGLPLVNSDYRALARWPEYLHHAWEDLKAAIQSPPYAQACDALALSADAAADRLEEPVTISPDILRREGVPATELENLVRVARLFADLLPGLILNVEGFRQAVER